MKGWSECPFCKGTGTYDMEGDLHRSAGTVPCLWKTEGDSYRGFGTHSTAPAPVTEIVKVQMPLYQSAGPKTALIYDQNLKVVEQRPLTSAEKKIIARRPKVFCEAIFNKAGGWDLVREAKNQHQHW